MKKNKGFTLVELLGTIVLLAIISLIIIPNVIKIQKENERESFEKSVNSLLRSAQIYHANNDFLNFPISGLAANDSNLEAKNIEQFKSGMVKLINNDYFYAENISNGQYCAIGTRNDLTIQEGGCPNTPAYCYKFEESTGTITGFN